MPSIEITVTAEQAERLAKGENITIAPAPEGKHLIAVHSAGTIYEVFDAVLRGSTWFGSWTLLRYSSGRMGSGSRVPSGGFPLHNHKFIEVD